MSKIAIVQSNYIPWKGYFDLIDSVDVFMLFDSVQYTRRDWRNRNQIKTAQGLTWLTVPVEVKGRYNQSINETRISGTDWAQSHWRSIVSAYSRAPFFAAESEWLAPLYSALPEAMLSSMNERFLRAICARLNITTPILRCEDYNLLPDRSARLADLCVQTQANVYVSGPAARSYLEDAPFAERGIAVEWFDYSAYPQYPQLWGPFEHGVSVLDLIFNCGPEAERILRSRRST
ncbi:WbqC family protein [Agrobacterium sp. YIC 4121]|uniref:WbqC family protein n=1 Tax=Agrobacterium sp. YIC 4121 TaxID=1923829 RepID=UPI00098FDBCD|nr:WbqC family protein [Agrobacterium sp. YIC 4121]OOO28593.1 hypothetical protein BTE54_18655 [Agrobacterium sp. YIC 4121]